MTEQLLAYSWGEFWGDSESALAHFVSWSLIVIGLIGTIVPFLPGPILIFVGALVHRIWVGGDHTVSILGLVALGLLTALSMLADWAAGAIGAKVYGASKWGIWGAIIGGIVGIFFSLPGLILGPLIGAFAFEYFFAKKDIEPSARSTWGTIVGTLAGLLSKGIISLGMLALILVDMFWL